MILARYKTGDKWRRHEKVIDHLLNDEDDEVHIEDRMEMIVKTFNRELETARVKHTAAKDGEAKGDDAGDHDDAEADAEAGGDAGPNA